MAPATSLLVLPCMFAGVGAVRRSLSFEEAEPQEAKLKGLKLFGKKWSTVPTTMASLQEQLAGTKWTYSDPSDIFSGSNATIQESKSAIKAAHSLTQTAFDAFSFSLPFLSAVYGTVDTWATTATTNLNNAGTAARDALDVALDNQTAEAQRLTAKQEACQQKDDASPFSYERPDEVETFSCDFSTSVEQCMTAFNEFKQKTATMLTTLASNVKEHNAAYAIEAGNCSTATTAHTDQVKLTGEAEEGFRTAVATANSEKWKNLAKHCTSGFTAGRLCSVHDAWEDLKANAEGTDNVNSQLQRESEWNVLHLSSCLSRKFPEVTGPNALQECMLEVNYDDQVGTLEYYEQKAGDSVSALNCDAHERAYKSWTMPSNLDVISGDLKTEITDGTETDVLTGISFGRCTPVCDPDFSTWLDKKQDLQETVASRTATVPDISSSSFQNP